MKTKPTKTVHHSVGVKFWFSVLLVTLISTRAKSNEQNFCLARKSCAAFIGTSRFPLLSNQKKISHQYITKDLHCQYSPRNYQEQDSLFHSLDDVNELYHRMAREKIWNQPHRHIQEEPMVSGGDIGSGEQLKKPSNFTMNVARAMATISRDAPLMFEEEPHMDIFEDRVVLRDSKGVLARGKMMYGAVFASLRLMQRMAGMHSRVQLLSLKYLEGDHTIQARIEIRAENPLLRKQSFHLDLVATYFLNTDDGLIYEHAFNNMMRNHMFEVKWSPVFVKGLQPARLARPDS